MLDRTPRRYTKIFFDRNLIYEVDNGTFRKGCIGLWTKALNQDETASVNSDDISLWP